MTHYEFQQKYGVNADFIIYDTGKSETMRWGIGEKLENGDYTDFKGVYDLGCLFFGHRAPRFKNKENAIKRCEELILQKRRNEEIEISDQTTETMKTTIEKITPEMAKSYLETMPPYQRRISKSSVHKMSKDMEMGRWITTHQGIAFNDKGQLFDGQHRLNAIIYSECTVEMIVFRDVPEESWHAIDIGRKRDLSAITGIDKREVEVYRCACEFGLKVREPSFMDLELIQNSKIGEAVREVLRIVPTTRRTVSSAPVKLVVALWRIKSRSMYPIDQYRALTLQHYNMMSAASQSFNRQIESSAAGTRRMSGYDAAARAYRVFDPSASELVKIVVSDIGSVTEKIGMDIMDLLDT